MLEPIGIVKVYVREEDWRNYLQTYENIWPKRYPRLEKEYLNLFCVEWAVTPKSYEMALECEGSVDILSDFLLKEESGNDDALGIYSMVPLDQSKLQDYKEKAYIEGCLVLNDPLHSFVYGHEEPDPMCRLVTKWGNETIWQGGRENPKIKVTKGSGEIKDGWPIWFSDSALHPIRQILSYC